MEAILNPALLLFLSGILIGVLFKLILPNSISKYLGYYLLLSLGLKGGSSLQENGFINEVISALTLGVVFALLIPFIAYFYLKNLLNSDDAAALSGTYGSVSAVTFVTAIAYLSTTNQEFDNYMSAVLVVMEFPAIFMALYLVTHNKQNKGNNLETIKTEIILSDIDIIQKKLEKGKKKLLEEKQIKILEEKLNQLNEGKEISINDNDEKKFLSSLGLLSIKPKIIVCNVDEGSLANGNAFTKEVQNKYSNEKVVTICADIEDQIMGLDNSERETFMKEIGLNKTGLNQLIKEGYELLNLDTFFTSGPEESRAWTVEKNTIAPKAASVIHTDFEKNFIRAEAVTCEDFIKYGSAEKCKENGKLRIEGKDYIVKDGDVLYFRVNP